MISAVDLKESMAPIKEKVSNYIPDDLAFDILSKLPVKSLKRFSCVRKSWSNLFENPQFMSMYRNNFLSKDDDDNSHSRLLLKQSVPPQYHVYDDNLFLLSGETFENSVKLDWPPPFQENHQEGMFILGSVVNGMLCLYQGDGIGNCHWMGLKVVLWNPSTEEFKVIPPCFVDRPLGVPIHVHLHGFGYDPVADDYKLIRYFCFFDDVPKNGPIHPNNEPLWQIYSLRSNCWRELDVEMPNHYWAMRSLNTGFAVYLDGVCHWWGYKEYKGEEVLVSFNLSDEVFHTTPLNRCDDVHGRHLVVLKGSIAMISMYSNIPCFDISILGDLGVTESWTKLFSIGPLPCLDQPIGIGKKGDIFFRKNNNELARFNLNTEVIEDIGVEGEYSCCQIVIYNESLLPIGGINS